jgi:hypothetical protein
MSSERRRWPSTSETTACADNAFGQMYPAPFVQRRLVKSHEFFQDTLAKLGAMDHVRYYYLAVCLCV